jgi:hypothetical protein
MVTGVLLGRWVWNVEKISGTGTACFSLGEVGGMAVDVQNHVAGGVSDDGGGVGRSIVH